MASTGPLSRGVVDETSLCPETARDGVIVFVVSLADGAAVRATVERRAMKDIVVLVFILMLYRNSSLSLSLNEI